MGAAMSAARRFCWLSGAILVALVSLPSLSAADSGKMNLHIDLGFGLPTAGYLAPPGENDNTAMIGGQLGLALDYEIAGPFALEIALNAGYLIDMDSAAPQIVGGGVERPDGGRLIWNAAIGGRFRFLEKKQLFLAAHLGIYGFDGTQLGADASLGYEFILSQRLNLGLFARFQVTARGQGAWPDEDHFDAAVFVGASLAYTIIEHERGEPEPEPEPELEPTDEDIDGDGILNAVDQCPTDPEDRDRFQDDDGCPDPDNDGDGILDTTDTCPNDREDFDSFQDEDGCPDPDNDNDGTPDTTDTCPNEPGPASNNGCPEPDRDNDTLPDRRDNCPDEAGPVENQGCPEPQQVVITETGLRILDSVYFRLGRHQIDPRSFPLLDNVARVINSHPEIGRIRIEGHTDARGNARTNTSLSQRRAREVMKYLTRQGRVNARRLEARGFGPTRPLNPAAATEDEHAANRRVEFVIIQEQ